MSQNFHQKYQKTPIFASHTGARVSFIFSLANFVKIPLFFTRKLVFNVPAVSARHPIWRLSVDGLAASEAWPGPAPFSGNRREPQGTRDRVWFGYITTHSESNIRLFACFISHKDPDIMSSTIKESKLLSHPWLT